MNDQLEQQLTDLGRHIAFPATPELAAPVRQRLGHPVRRPIITRWRAVLAAVLVALAVGFGVPPVRTAVAHWLGIQGVVITPVPSLPAVHPSTPPSSSALGAGLDLGRPTTIAHASDTVGFTPLVPSGLGVPDAVYTRSDIGPVVSLVYAPRDGLPQSGRTGVGLLITEFRGSLNPEFTQKFVGPGTTVVPVTVTGQAGYWIGGAHDIDYQLPDGTSAADTLRLAAPTLVFERGDLTLRIEGARTEAHALALAATLS